MAINVRRLRVGMKVKYRFVGGLRWVNPKGNWLKATVTEVGYDESDGTLWADTTKDCLSSHSPIIIYTKGWAR